MNYTILLIHKSKIPRKQMLPSPPTQSSMLNWQNIGRFQETPLEYAINFELGEEGG